MCINITVFVIGKTLPEETVEVTNIISHSVFYFPAIATAPTPTYENY